MERYESTRWTGSSQAGAHYTSEVCGRYFRLSDRPEIVERLQVRHLAPQVPERLASYEVAPGTDQPVIRHVHASRVRELLPMRWGIVPSFAMNMAEFSGISTCNVRAEAVLHYQIWRKPFQIGRRCLVPAAGFFAWRVLHQQAKKPHRKPYAITVVNEKTFAFAGLWDACQDRQTGKWLQSFTIITTVANELVSQVHSRMPVVLQPTDYDEWLSEDAAPIHLLKPFPAQQMSMEVVSRKLSQNVNYPVELLNST